MKPPPVPDELIRTTAPAVDRVALFEERARAVGLEVERVAPGEVDARLAAVLRAAGVRRAVGRVPPGCGVESVADPFEADAGIAAAAWGIAGSGSLAVHTGPEQGRTLSLVPPLHVALLPAARILRDLVDYLRGPVSEAGSAAVLITGPSKTADIEGELVRGVHGPARVVVLLVEDRP